MIFLFLHIVAPLQKPNHVPSANGCGSYNISIPFDKLEAPEFTECCNVHDLCYEECYKTQKDCDNSFNTCLNAHCDAWAIENNWTWVKKGCKSK
jgi:secretory phospholipase A2